MAPIGLNLIATVQLFLLQTVRLSERLACSGDVATSALTCRRRIRRVLRSSDETFAIPDARSVAYRASGHTTSSHTYMNTSSINAIDNHGRDVVLLSVPNGAVSDAAAMEEQLRNLARSMSPGLSSSATTRRTSGASPLSSAFGGSRTSGSIVFAGSDRGCRD
jgi:hypothetical protein